MGFLNGIHIGSKQPKKHYFQNSFFGLFNAQISFKLYVIIFRGQINCKPTAI